MNTNEKIKKTFIKQLDLLMKALERTMDVDEIYKLAYAIIETVKFMRDFGI